MNLDIEIEGVEISEDIKVKFLDEFFARLSRLDTQSRSINDEVCSELATMLSEKPTDLLPKYKRVTKEDAGKTCTVCCEEFKENEYKRTLRCDHVFHKKCIDKWFNKFRKVNCPTCRSNSFATIHQQISSQSPHQ